MSFRPSRSSIRSSERGDDDHDPDLPTEVLKNQMQARLRRRSTATSLAQLNVVLKEECIENSLHGSIPNGINEGNVISEERY